MMFEAIFYCLYSLQISEDIKSNLIDSKKWHEELSNKYMNKFIYVLG